MPGDRQTDLTEFPLLNISAQSSAADHRSRWINHPHCQDRKLYRSTIYFQNQVIYSCYKISGYLPFSIPFGMLTVLLIAVLTNIGGMMIQGYHVVIISLFNEPAPDLMTDS